MNINDEGIGVYINEIMLDWMGYNGSNDNCLKSLKRHIERNFEDTDYKILKNKDYELFLNQEKLKNQDENVLTLISKTYPVPSTGSSARSKTHLIVMPDAFRLLCMMINTKRGKYIKQYYLTLEKLIQAYFIYQCVFNELCYKKELVNLKNLPHIKNYTEIQNRIRLNEEIRNLYKIGYVYFIQEELTKHIKIGYTYNLKNRLCALQTGNSQKLSIVHVQESYTPYKLEQDLHKKYIDYHIRGEWYLITTF